MGTDTAEKQRRIFAENLNARMNQLGLNQDDIVKALGYSSSTVSDWCNAKKYPRVSRMQELADFLGVALSSLREEQKGGNGISIPLGFGPLPEMADVPLVGRIACGQPITAEENLEGYVSIPAEWHATFTLICEGDSMEPTIHDGDLVAIRKDVEVENGQIAAVRIEDEATLKRVYLHEDYIELRPENPSYGSIIRRKEEMNDVTIEGRAVGLCRGI